MKYIITICLFVLAFTACYEDKGNYDYQPSEELKIEGIDTLYTRLLFAENLKISPTVDCSDEHADMAYTWSWYDEKVLPLTEKVISETKDLDLELPAKISRYCLIFRATNKRTGYTRAVQTYLQMENDYSFGWYVVKTINGNGDIDLFKNETEYVENTLLKANDRELEGKARKLTLAFRQKSFDPVTGELKEYPQVLHMLTEKDIWMIDPSTMVVLRDKSNLFRESPEKYDFCTTLDDNSSLYVINDGKIYPSPYMSPNDGSFSLPKWIDEENTDYCLSKYSLSDKIYRKLLLFDELSSSFLSVGNDNIMVHLVDSKESDISATNNNMKLIYMGVSSTLNTQYGIMQDKVSGERYVATIVTAGSWSNDITIKITPIAPTTQAYVAEYFTLNMDEPIFYFVGTDGKLYSYDITSGSEKLQFQPDAGERITYVRHRNYKTNYIIVGTENAGQYKVRMFEKNAGNLVGQPALVLEGEGEVNDVLYFDSSLGQFTKYYPQSY